jgi:hypothetical protein
MEASAQAARPSASTAQAGGRSIAGSMFIDLFSESLRDVKSMPEEGSLLRAAIPHVAAVAKTRYMPRHASVIAVVTASRRSVAPPT